jgi:hypothetical protein
MHCTAVIAGDSARQVLFDHSATCDKPNALSPCILMPQWMVRKAREISLRAATVPVEAGCR